MATLLETLPEPSTHGVDRVYRQLKEILGIAAAQQAEGSIQCQAVFSVLGLSRSKDVWCKMTKGPLVAGSSSSPVRPSVHDRLGRPVMHPIL
jgi:hypothetical protein